MRRQKQIRLNSQISYLTALLCLSYQTTLWAMAAPGPHGAPANPGKAPAEAVKGAGLPVKIGLSPLTVPRTPAAILKRLEQIEASLMKPEARPSNEQKKALDGELTALTWAIEKSAGGARPGQKLRALHSYAFYVRGILHFEMKDMAGSMRFLDCALKDDAKNAKAYEQRGTNYVLSGRAREGLSDFDSAIKNGLDSDFAFINRGSMYVSTGQNEKAVDDLSRALKMRKGSASEWMPLMLRARAYAGLKNYAAARQDAQNMLSLGGAPQSVQTNMQNLIADLDARANEKARPPADKPFQAERARVDTLIAPYVETARKGLPAAKARFLQGLPAKEWMSVTTRIYGPQTDPGAVGAMEQVFVTVKSWNGDTIDGTLASPVHLPNHSQGEPISVAEKDVLDWTIVRADGSEEGNAVGKFVESPEAKAALQTKEGQKTGAENQPGGQNTPTSVSSPDIPTAQANFPRPTSPADPESMASPASSISPASPPIDPANPINPVSPTPSSQPQN